MYYRFGFNGKEKDNNGEWGNSAHYDYGFRIYDPTYARFLSVDPLTASYPSWSPYPFAMNRPIDGIDLDGKEEWDAIREWFMNWIFRGGAPPLEPMNDEKILYDRVEKAQQFQVGIETVEKYNEAASDVYGCNLRLSASCKLRISEEIR